MLVNLVHHSLTPPGFGDIDHDCVMVANKIDWKRLTPRQCARMHAKYLAVRNTMEIIDREHPHISKATDAASEALKTAYKGENGNGVAYIFEMLTMFKDWSRFAYSPSQSV